MFRFRPRFSLRTLLFGVLASASAVTLWMHYEPWRVERTYYPGKNWHGTNTEATFSPDGKWVHLNVRKHDYERHTIGYINLLFNIETGQSTDLILKLWENQERDYDRSELYAGFTSDSHVLFAGVSDGDRSLVTVRDLPSLAERPVPADLRKEFDIAYSVQVDRYLKFYRRDHSCVLMDLQSNAIVLDDLNALIIHHSSERDRLTVLDAEGSVRILDASTRREIQRVWPPTDWKFRYVEYLTGQTLFVFATMTEYDEYREYAAYDSNRVSLRFDLRDPGNPQIRPARLFSVSPDGTLHIYAYDNEIAVVQAGDSQELCRIRTDWANYTEIIGWFPDSKRFYMHGTNTVCEARTGRLLYELPGGETATYSKDYTRVLYQNNVTKDYHIHDGEDGKFLQALPGSLIGSKHYQQAFLPDARHLYNYNPDTGEIQIWKRYRPEYWWGLVCLPEFWLTTVFAVAFVWSLRRD